MYNYFMLIGRVTKDVVINQLEDGRRVINLSLAVLRPFKNMEGTYDTDFFNVTLWEFLVDIAGDRFKKGDKVAVKGRIVPKKIKNEKGITINTNELVGERLIFFENSSRAKYDAALSSDENVSSNSVDNTAITSSD